MSKLCLDRCNIVLAAFCLALLASPRELRATLTYWDPTGATASSTPNGNWEDSAWATSSALTATPQAWVAVTAAEFSAGTAATGAFTVNISTTQSVAGIFNSLTASGGAVTISGTGTLSVPSGQQGFYTTSPGSTIIDVPITGTCQLVPESTGQLYLNGTNTYSGGTQFGFSGGSFTGIVNINNPASVGTGPLTMYSAGGAIVLQGAAAVTIPNSVVAAAVNMNIVGNAAGLTFGGPWNLAATPSIGCGGTGNLVIISGVMSGAGGLNKYNPSTLMLTAANSYTGATPVSNGTLALGASGSINNNTSITLTPGANGTVFDVSAIHAYTLGGSTTLVALGKGTATTTEANIKGASGGTVSLGSRPIILSFTPTTFSGDTAHPSLYISQGALTLNNNSITVTNAAATPLGTGTYRLIQVGNGSSGTISATPNVTVSVKGAGIATNLVAALAVSNGNVNLLVRPPAVFTNFSTAESNSFGVGPVSFTISAKVGAGSVHPAVGETVTVTFNGVAHNVSVSDTSGDFSYTLNPQMVLYSSSPYPTLLAYSGDTSLGPVNTTTNIAPNSFYTNDDLPGFFSGLNLFFTNTAGIPMYTWSTTNVGLPVTDWTLEGQMQEQPLNDGSGKSRYSINVTPAYPLVYYISGPTQNWPYLSPTGVQWITTDTNGNYTYFSSNVSISTSGFLGLPSSPVIVQQPVSQTVLQGKNVTFGVVVTGSQPLDYQWFFNTNTPVTLLSANSSCTLTAVTSNQAGIYTVFATNQYGTVTSSNVVLTVVSPPSLMPQLTSNGFQLNSTSIPGNSYLVQATTNLGAPITWTTVASGTADSNGIIQFTNSNVATNTGLFYRLAFP